MLYDKDNGEYVDTDTGEVYEGMPVIFGVRKKMPEEFVMVFQQALSQILDDVREGTLTNDALKVMLVLMQRLSWENYVHVQQSEVAKVVGIHRVNASRAINLLTERGYVEKGPRGSHSYRLSLEVGWKGRAKNYTPERERVRNGSHLKVIEGAKTDG